MHLPMLGSTAFLFVAVVSGVMSTNVQPPRTPAEPGPPMSFCAPPAAAVLRGEIRTCPQSKMPDATATEGRRGLRRCTQRFGTVLSLRASAAATGFDIRRAPTRVGGGGRFLRTPEVLQLLIDDREETLQDILLPELKKTTDSLEPKQKEMAELQKKYDETESEVFGSQILPLEVSMRPLIALQKVQQQDVDELKSEIETLVETRQAAMQKYAGLNSAQVLLAGRSKKLDVPLQRSFAFGPGADSKLTLSSGEKGAEFKLDVEWDNRELPVFVDADTEGAKTRGLVFGFANPEEGPRRLSAVAEWKGATDSQDIAKRKRELLDYIACEGLRGLDVESTRVSFEGDAVPFRRFNELWVSVQSPDGIGWYDYAAKIATDLPAKNASAFSLKDCPWACPRAWLDPDELPSGEEAGDIAWKATSAFGSSSLSCSVAALRPGQAGALDRSSSGELALSVVQVEGGSVEDGDEGEDDEGLFAVAGLPGLPLEASAVESALSALLQGLQDTGYGAVDEGSFRVLVRSAQEAELWLQVADK